MGPIKVPSYKTFKEVKSMKILKVKFGEPRCCNPNNNNLLELPLFIMNEENEKVFCAYITTNKPDYTFRIVPDEKYHSYVLKGSPINMSNVLSVIDRRDITNAFDFIVSQIILVIEKFLESHYLLYNLLTPGDGDIIFVRPRFSSYRSKNVTKYIMGVISQMRL